jgi:PAS domain S-box-containing protein
MPIDEARSGPQNEPPDLRTLVDAIPALVVCTLPDGSVEFASRGWREYLGATQALQKDGGWEDALHPEELSHFIEARAAARSTSEAFEAEARLRRADGEYRWFLIRDVPQIQEAQQQDQPAAIVRWYGTAYDIDARKQADEKLRKRVEELRTIIETIPAFVGTALPDGSVDFVSQSWLDYTGLSREQWLDWGWMTVTHPDDVEGAVEKWQAALAAGTALENEQRCRHADGRYRWFLGRNVPLRNEHGTIVKWYGTLHDIDDRKRAEDDLRLSEFYLAEGQRLARAGSWAFDPAGFFTHWSRELLGIYGLDPARGAPTLSEYLATIHPEDREFMAQLIEKMLREGLGCDVKKRILRPDGDLRYIRCVGVPVFEKGTVRSILGTAIDITEQEKLALELQRRGMYLAEAQNLSHTGSFGWNVPSGEIVWSEETFRIFEYDPALTPTLQAVLQHVHPEDRTRAQQMIERAAAERTDFDLEHRLVMPDGRVKYLHVVARPVQDSSGHLGFVGAVTDITARKEAEARIRVQETEHRQMLDLVPQHVYVQGPDGSRLYANRSALEYYGLTLEDFRNSDRGEVFYPGDWERLMSKVQREFLRGDPHAGEARLRRHDGRYRWFFFRRNPLRDEYGRIARWYVAATDIEDRKLAEEKLQNENVALREEIDKTSMFEEIIGSSPVLQAVLSRVSKVAPTDSTVLITGETGTGKELVARAIHKSSQRASRAFVSVNCAAIPRDLIASELFGHEKGAFTGATQQRLGRFELAGGGTIFLDEVGELPTETQIALLRVLQEHEFERVGGTRSIQTNVRVIAATNRDLLAAIAAGTFRSDLFYRLNVFPIEIPPLRERENDIPLLVEYFIDRYARKAGKSIKRVNKQTLRLFESYPWPGNIRELQNVIERSVIVCETENFSVDESWLSHDRPASDSKTPPLTLAQQLVTQEKEMIENALRERRGRVSGPDGAAVRLGMPRSTLESKIRSLKIPKHRFLGPADPDND